MVEIWVPPTTFGIPITSIFAFNCLETAPKASITSGTISALTLFSVLITLAKYVYLLTFSFSLVRIL